MKRIIFAILAISIISCGKKEEKPIGENTKTEEILAVTAVMPEMRSVGESIEASGTLSSKSELKLAFKTGGMIKRMYVNEGQFVKAGQLLAELDLSEIDAQVAQAKLGLQKSERDLERVKKLFADEVATQTALDDATTGYEVARQTVQTAVFNQKLSKIYAPQSGRILRKIADQGELITPFAPALVLGTGNSAFIVNIGLVDKEVVKVNLGDKAQIMLDAYPGEILQAKITQIAQMVNPATGTYEVEMEINAGNKKLISGFVAKAIISPPSKGSFLSVPVESLVEANENQANVFVISGDKVTKTKIEIGRLSGKYVEVKSGVTNNDQIVFSGANFLSDNQKVKVIK